MTAHSELPRHCATCGIDWPAGENGLCPECGAGLPCRADTTDPVAPDPSCAGSRGRLRPRCPVHGMPDCSPLLNGCSRLTAGS